MMLKNGLITNSKRVIEKKQKQLVIWLEIKLLMKSSQKTCLRKYKIENIGFDAKPPKERCILPEKKIANYWQTKINKKI